MPILGLLFVREGEINVACQNDECRFYLKEETLIQISKVMPCYQLHKKKVFSRIQHPFPDNKIQISPKLQCSLNILLLLRTIEVLIRYKFKL